MKTTVEIDEHLLTRAKDEARRRRTTLRRLIEDGLRGELSRRPGSQKRYRMRDASAGSPDGLQPGVDLANWDRMLDVLYEGRGRVIAVDTNVLVHAHRRESNQHDKALECMRALTEGGRPWVIPWPCLHEFVAIVTHPRLFKAPSTLDEVVAQVEVWRGSPEFLFLGEAGDHLTHLTDVLRASGAAGPKVHDAKIAAICLAHAVRELWSVDRDFRAFPGLRVVNPLVHN